MLKRILVSTFAIATGVTVAIESALSFSLVVTQAQQKKKSLNESTNLRSVVKFFSPASETQTQSQQMQSQVQVEETFTAPIINNCYTAVGYWWWDERRFPVSIYNDGGILADDAASGGRISANWTCVDFNTGLIKISWSTGITDFMYPVDQNRMSGNNGVNVVNAVRRDVGL